MYRELIKSEAVTKMSLQVDLLVLNDNLSADFIKGLREKKVFDPEKTVIIIDQIVPPNSPQASAVGRQLMQLSKEQGIKIYFGRVMTSEYLRAEVKSGWIVAAKNPTVITAGIRGAFGLCVEDEEIEHAYETGEITIKTPEKIRLKLMGGEQLSLKDAALHLIKEADKECLKDALVEIDEEVIKGHSAEEATGFFTLLTKVGVCCAVAGTDIKAQKVVFVDISQTKAMVALDNGFSKICHVEELRPKKVQVVFIGGSIGGTFEEIRMAAEVLRGKTIAYGVRLSVAPASAQIYSQMASAGYITDILNAGGQVLNQCADPEIQCRVGIHEVMVSNDWKNEPGYAGYDSSETILASTATAVAAALAGEIGNQKGKEEEKEKPIIIEGRCWKFGDDIDTDIIIPTQWVCVPMEEMKHHAFEPLRPGLADTLRDGDIIVAGDNFGCGSSREMAAEVIKENGVRCIIAKSFARIFFRNAINNGILLIECPELPDNVAEGDVVCVELNHQITCNGKVYPIGKIQQNLYEIIADGGLVRNIEKKVKNGEL